MSDKLIYEDFSELKSRFRGEIDTSASARLMYATDASVYREIPLAVCTPVDAADVVHLIRFASLRRLTVIPRGGGTSLAGQVVGNGIVADISRHMNRILEVNEDEKWVRVQPGVVLDDLNRYLHRYGLFFAPDTSTSNRCVIGGMAGNNSCGSRSLVYGSTRDHLIGMNVVLSDGTEAQFMPLDKEGFEEKCIPGTLEGRIYRQAGEILSNPVIREEIRREFPAPEVKRRNTGYALDMLLDTVPFTGGGKQFNFCSLLAGSEGTLAFTTELKVALVPLPPPVKALVCIHMEKLENVFSANLTVLRHNPYAVELMDRTVLHFTKENREQAANRFFIKGDPGAILIVELAGNSTEEVKEKAGNIEKEMRDEGYGYYFPVITGEDINRVWNLRKAALGVLSNMKGDARPVSVIEDTAVDVREIPAYISGFRRILSRYGKECVYHAHIGSGELHLRPVLNLKDPEDVKIFRKLAYEVALLVKKHRGSLSGEHGDGRLRGEFIPVVLGSKNHELLCRVKECWDPGNVFNPGKITSTPPMDTHLRYEPGKEHREPQTVYNFSATAGFLRAAEKCNGSGDCRKTEGSGGVMCPSYMATREETDTTRARANILREYLTGGPEGAMVERNDVLKVMDLCILCKGCKSECPSGVDMAKLKTEFLQHYYDKEGIPFRVRLIAGLTIFNRMGSLWPAPFNFFLRNRLSSLLVKRIAGFAPERSLPLIGETTMWKWAERNLSGPVVPGEKGRVRIFTDEFTCYNDVHVGIAAIRLLSSLGYSVEMPRHHQSGRALISKGLLRRAAGIARENIRILSDDEYENIPLVGIEPSAILSLRDEYPDLAGVELKEKAKKLAGSAMLIDEFISREIDRGNITKEVFTTARAGILLHGHCQQKALSSTADTLKMLSCPENYTAEEIPSGCCGMAGSFGYEKEHYDLSMKIGETVLFPEIRSASGSAIIAANGTSCRVHILDGTGRKALHPVEILFDALLSE